MAKTNINIQDGFLFQHLKAGSQLRLVLTTGTTLAGQLRRFDRFAVVLGSSGHEILVYKHAIATVEEAPSAAP